MRSSDCQRARPTGGCGISSRGVSTTLGPASRRPLSTRTRSTPEEAAVRTARRAPASVSCFSIQDRSARSTATSSPTAAS
eukprot:6033746-Heterocapsa_arctica.AAC.1